MFHYIFSGTTSTTMATTTMQKTRLEMELSNAEYHASEGISSSVLRSMNVSPAYCYARHFDPERKRDQSPALVFGSAAHKLILEESDFANEFAVAPIIDRRTKHGKELYADWQATVVGKEIISKDDYDTIRAMRDAVYSHDAAGAILSESGDVEFSGWWQEPRFGLTLKYRPDFATKNFIVDYKTTTDASPDGFARSINNYGYHQAAAHYLDGEDSVRYHRHDNFLFIVQEKVPPYQVGVYSLSRDAIDLGRRINSARLNQLSYCLQTNQWPSFCNNAITEIDLPKWAYN